jgi:hypothetical protein
MHAAWLTTIHYRPVSWLLVVVLLMAMLMPAHYHLHHLSDIDPAEHAHVLDLHLIAESKGHAHHDEDTSIIAATPDVIVKTDSSMLASFVPLALFLLLLSTLADKLRLRYGHCGVRLVRQHHYYSPPLRAPPAP